MRDIIDAAAKYRARGWRCFPVVGKRPTMRGWTTADLDAAAFGVEARRASATGLAVRLGEPSGGIVDVDLDCAEAISLAAEHLPPTGAVWGRPGAPSSHRLYLAQGATTRAWRIGTETTCEIRSSGAASVLPPSRHESGEQIAWTTEGSPAVVSGEDLAAAVARLHAAVRAARGLPAEEPRKERVSAGPPRSVDLDSPAARYCAERARELPRAGSACPLCGHSGCFGAMRGAPGKWACFSAGHPDDLGAVGEGGFHHGDVLDLDAHAAGRTPAEHLRAEGYLGRSRDGWRPSARARGPVAAKDAQQALQEPRPPAPRLRVVGEDERRSGAVGEAAPQWEERAQNLRWPGGAWVVEDGRLLRETGAVRKDGTIPTALVSHAPIYVAGRAADVLTGEESLLLRWEDREAWRERWVPRGQALVATELRRLAGVGVPVSSETAGELVRWLDAFAAANPSPATRTSSSLGWVGGDPAAGFMLGAEHLRLPEVPEVSFRAAGEGEEQLAAAMRPRGTLEDWQAAVRPLLSRPVAARAIYTALAAPLLVMLGARGFVVDWSGGGNSTGKSTACLAAMSVWGDPGELKNAWNLTPVRIERLLSLCAGGLPVWLDDTREAQKREVVGETIFAVHNGTGRGRGAVEGSRRTARWRTCLLSTGEESALSFTPAGGERARVICEEQLPLGGLGREEGALARAVEWGVSQAYGTAGRAWVEYLLAVDVEELRKEYAAVVEAMMAELERRREGDVGVAGRQAQHVAVLILARELALRARLFGSIADAEAGSAWDGEGALRQGRALAPEMRGWGLVSDWLAGEAERVADGGDLQRSPTRGWIGRRDRDRGLVLLLASPVEQMLLAGGLRPIDVFRGAKSRGWLLVQDGNRYQFRFGDGKVWGYAIRAESLSTYGDRV